MEPRMRIVFEEWVAMRPRRDVNRVPRFGVARGNERLFVVDAEIPGSFLFRLLEEKEQDAAGQKRVDQALVRLAVRRIESDLAAVAFSLRQATKCGALFSRTTTWRRWRYCSLTSVHLPGDAGPRSLLQCSWRS